jgi:hypothetical protein
VAEILALTVLIPRLSGAMGIPGAIRSVGGGTSPAIHAALATCEEEFMASETVARWTDDGSEPEIPLLGGDVTEGVVRVGTPCGVRCRPTRRWCTLS